MTTRTKRRPTFWDMFIPKKEVIGVLGTAASELLNNNKKGFTFAWNLTKWLNPAFLAEFPPCFFSLEDRIPVSIGIYRRTTHSNFTPHHRLTTVRFSSDSVYLLLSLLSLSPSFRCGSSRFCSSFFLPSAPRPLWGSLSFFIFFSAPLSIGIGLVY